MCRCSAVMKALMFLTFSLHPSLAVTHILEFIVTGVTTGQIFPEFTSVAQVDEEMFSYYDSDIKKALPKTEWIKKINNDYPDYWNTQALLYKEWQGTFTNCLNIVMKNFNHTTGVHTAQLMFGCELDDGGTTRGHAQLGYDGEDFLSLDLKTKTWIPAKHGAEINKHIWNYVNETTKDWNDYVSTTCIDRIKMYVSYRAGTPERKVHPEVSVFQKHSPSPEVVCHATGFYPKAVMITWQKDGEDVHEDVELRETLPNQDGSFQKRSILKVPAEELQKHTYTCVVQHSSLEKELVREVPKDGGSDGAPIAIITAVVASLVAVVAGIVVWKKKNSGFTPVPPKPSSEGDSSSNNS
ncbi:BOLA class I histocompatibility antigen, alpha chain BL3-7-like isoform X1 [Clarias gariepinus]|uniref:BOLA class I histocompatibility antigen, alpha chain BL3-7-like isoform X1 n=1 Tax=Clarias gariepinus TaxID=13013 RepID=UPI00234E36C7|nr:BOLA class I histocompatibility antigen, alpha chain BL3-7-like isoform X1 [Clarias gariepinus]